MSSEHKPCVEIKQLSKCYRIYTHPQDRLKQICLPPMLRKILRGKVNYFDEYWALKEVSLNVSPGETLGILGQNGSGKSTLLQLVCGTLTPTQGSLVTRGRMAALLELGSGFNPEFTGRENILLNAAILGLTQTQISESFGEIIDFAEIGTFLDQPVKSYSSGMMLRLAFAVAIHISPDILVVDEALAVGDERFQRKCFAKIERMKAKGTAILFVSHSASAVLELCDRAILLDKGELLCDTDPKTAVGAYQKLLYAPVDRKATIKEAILSGVGQKAVAPAQVKAQTPDSVAAQVLVEAQSLEEEYDPNLLPTTTTAYEPNGAIISNPAIKTLAGEKANILVQGRTYLLSYQADFQQTATQVVFGMLIKTTAGVELGGGASATASKHKLKQVRSGTEVMVEFQFDCNLNKGTYFLNAGVMADKCSDITFLHRVLDMLMFRVVSPAGALNTGIVDFKCEPRLHIRSQNTHLNTEKES